MSPMAIDFGYTTDINPTTKGCDCVSDSRVICDSQRLAPLSSSSSSFSSCQVCTVAENSADLLFMFFTADGRNCLPPISFESLPCDAVCSAFHSESDKYYIIDALIAHN